MKGVNTWWEGMPGERFWLGIADYDGKHEVLMAPCGTGHEASREAHGLITCVKDGDVVFHYDVAEKAIVAWSAPRGRVRRRQLTGWNPAQEMDQGQRVAARHPSWTIELEHFVALESVVPLADIARIQWDLFPALRAFEDMVGAPLYYPFAMGSPYGTRLLDGRVFKLPALFVACFPTLADVAQQVEWAVDVHASPAQLRLAPSAA